MSEQSLYRAGLAQEGEEIVRICRRCDDEYEGVHRAYCEQCIEEIRTEVSLIQEQQSMAAE